MSKAQTFTLMVLAGDGVGPEVIGQARRVLDRVAERRGLNIEIHDEPYGIEAFRDHGALIREAAMADLLAADAVLFGAIGGDGYDDVPPEVRRRGGLLRIRREMQVYANLRPVVGYAALADVSPLKPEIMQGVDLVVVRELTGGLYFGRPRGVEDLPTGGKRGVNTHVYESHEIERIARAAFDLARTRGGRVTSVDKSNVMESGALWREVVGEIAAAGYEDIELSHMLADNCAFQMVRAPAQFDVLLTDNMFGDLLSDCAAGVTGSLGMLPSASLGAPDGDGRRRALYEPVHGAAPDIAGKGVANPLGAILSIALMLRHSMGLEDEAARIEAAVAEVLAAGVRTPDIAPAGHKPASTSDMGDAVLGALDQRDI